MGGELRNEIVKTAADRTSPGRIYRHFSGWKFSQLKGAWEGSCGTKLERRGMPYEKSQILGMGCGDLYDFNDLHGI